MECPYNLATNRQTRMLADLSMVGCYNSTLSKVDRHRLMLASAKHNLQFMPFFMLTEYQKVYNTFKYYTQFIIVIVVIIITRNLLCLCYVRRANTLFYRLCAIVV